MEKENKLLKENIEKLKEQIELLKLLNKMYSEAFSMRLYPVPIQPVYITQYIQYPVYVPQYVVPIRVWDWPNPYTLWPAM